MQIEWDPETVVKQIQIGDQPTDDLLKEISEAAKHEITYDKEAPKLTEIQLSEFTPVYSEYYKPKKQQITLKLDADIIAAFKKTGKGYQTRINAVLRQALLNGV